MTRKEDNSMLMNELFRQEYCSIEYPCSIGVVSISKERNIYNALRKKYYWLAEESKKLFSEIYDSYTNCNDILMKCSTDFQKSISIVIDSVKDDLISLERYDMDFNTIYDYANENGYLDAFYEASDALCEKILAVNEDLEAQTQYREARKDNRARWEGGSFGGTIIDNYAHQASLGMRNVAEGMGHSLLNAVGNSMSKMAANAELKKIFNNSETRECIQKGVYEAAFHLHYVLIQLAEDCKEKVSWDIPSDNAVITSQRLLNNVKSGAFSNDKVNDIYQEILSLNPYSLELFENMLEVFGDKKGELTTLADYYGINLQQSKDSQALAYVMQIQGETEEDSVDAKDKLTIYCGTLSLLVTDDLECIKYINKRLEDFDLQYRTVNGVVCTTRNSADFAKKELKELQDFVGSITPPTSESLLDYEAELIEKRILFEAQFSSEVMPMFLEKINGYLMDFNKKFCSTGLLRKVDRKQAGKDRLLKMMKKADTSSLEKIDVAYQMMEENLPRLGLNHEEIQEAIEYLEKQKNKFLNPKGSMDVLKGFGKLFKR